MEVIKKLSPEVVNQIAAGEVVERPASVLKELMENAIDAGATVVDVFLEQGGITKIEVRDNGKGIAKEDLANAFERYATSKLHKIEDLQELLTYGFRGEALAAIASVSKVTLTSKQKESDPNQIHATAGQLSEIQPTSRSNGTTITIQELFYNVPARQKFLKSEDTEYKYLLEVFQAFALLNGKIHFSLTHNDKLIYTLPATQTEKFPIERVSQIFKVTKELLLPVSHEEYGISIQGVALHPKALGMQARFTKLFVNNRPIDDKGLMKAIQQGVAGYIPDTYKASGIFGITVASDQVDVNVHPRKLEVKFINPFRIFSALTHAIKATYAGLVDVEMRNRAEQAVSFTPQNAPYVSPAATPRFEQSTDKWQRKENNAYDRLRNTQQPLFFSDTSQAFIPPERNDAKSSEIPDFVKEQARDSLSEATITPILGRYITVAFMDEVWVVDQHAAAERIRYEKFKNSYLEGTLLEQQPLLAPISIHLSEQEATIAKKHESLFMRLGYSISFVENSLLIHAIPTFMQNADIENMLRDSIAELVEHDDLFLEPIIGDFQTNKDLSLIIATMACHNSVRMNQRISPQEARSIMTDLLKCQIPFACPHGRRVVWRLQKEEIDKQFMRT